MQGDKIDITLEMNKYMVRPYCIPSFSNWKGYNKYKNRIGVVIWPQWPTITLKVHDFRTPPRYGRNSMSYPNINTKPNRNSLRMKRLRISSGLRDSGTGIFIETFYEGLCYFPRDFPTFIPSLYIPKRKPFKWPLSIFCCVRSVSY